jgi:D-ala D-ala ligase N-terminus
MHQTTCLNRNNHRDSSKSLSPSHDLSMPQTKIDMKKKLRVGILFGGKSGEHEISLRSANSILKAIDRKKYDVVEIGITKQGRWLQSGSAQALLAGESSQPQRKRLANVSTSNELALA